jgi:hypothetical protein
MTDLDTLRHALRETPAETFGELDLSAMMATGARIRRRRRILVGGGVVVTTAVVLFAAATAGQLAHVAPSPARQPTPTTSTSVEPPAVSPLGDVISTGIHDAHGELVFYFVRVTAPELSKVAFGIAFGHRTPSGKLMPGTLNNDTNRPALEPGFHPIMGGNSETGVYVPAYGYFVGDAKRIEALVSGKIVEANCARWSEDPSVMAFWFPPDLVPDANLLGRPFAK